MKKLTESQKQNPYKTPHATYLVSDEHDFGEQLRLTDEPMMSHRDQIQIIS
jgi:hypothetical protein